MRSRQRFAGAILTWFALAVAAAVAAEPAGRSPKASGLVCVLNSYHPGFVWADREQEAILEALRKDRRDLQPVVEYLDGKRLPGGEHFDLLRDLLSRKYGDRQFAVVVALDNQALDFAVRYHASLFRGSPVVFCGISNFRPALLGDVRTVTGVIDTSNETATVNVMLHLHPRVRRIAVLHDYTPAGLASRGEFEAIMPRFAGRTEFEFFEDLAVEDLCARLERMPDTSLVLLLSYTADRHGRVFDVPELTELFSRRCRVPIYVHSEVRLGAGGVGGRLRSPTMTGVEAALLVARVLDGEPAAAIPIARKDTSRFMFDYAQLRRWRIPLSAVPDGSVIVNRPPSYWEIYRPFLLTVVGVCLSLCAVIVLLVLVIVQRRRSERVLRASESRLRAILDSLPDPAWMKDRQSRFVAVNPAFSTLTEPPTLDVIGKTAAAYLPADVAERMDADDVEVMRTGTTLRRELDVRTADGRVRWLDSVKAPLRGPNGEIVGTVGVSRDITDRKRTEERLRQSEKMDAIGQLAGGIAHDFNNQLTTIMGFAQMLSTAEMAEQQREYAASILAASKRAADLTRQLLAFARKGPFAPVATDMHAVIAEVVGLLARTVDKRILVRQRLEADTSTLMGDPTQLQNALLNLGLNARDAMPNGGELLFATAVVDAGADLPNPALRSGRWLQVSVTDTGVGMSVETQRHLFEPFFTTKDRGRGTGLGLAAVYGTVKNHCGTVSVYSELGHGTTFKLYFPLPAEAPVPRPETRAAAPVAAGARVLVVDDEPMVRALTTQMLRHLGHQVTACVDGEAGLAHYRQCWQQTDLVILDMIMPGLSGHETFMAMRRINPGVRVILSSGYSLNQEAQRVLDAGALGFLPKPFDLESLARQVAEALRRP